MRLAIYSDLHLEFKGWTPPPVQADVIVLAGDIHIGDAAFAWARRHFASLPVVYVAGNHEFFGADMPTVLDRMRAAATRYDIHFLHNAGIRIQGVQFLGSTLWTDFEFYGSDPARIARSIASARRGMRDYALIEYVSGQPLSPELTREIHLEQRAWLTTQLEQEPQEPVVVVTHHLPHPGSVHAKYEDDPLNPAFVSDLQKLFRHSVKL
ncbi:MAG: metallophosphoesterase, partial [Betaproteobacteria bacterium]